MAFSKVKMLDESQPTTERLADPVLAEKRKYTLAVVIPNYNHGVFLKNLIPLLLSQSRPPDEIILVDDASSDQSVEIIEAYALNDRRVKLFRNQTNQGVIASLNRGMKEVTSDYVTFPSADNLILPGMYQESLALLEKHPKAGLCCSDPYYLVAETQKKQLHRLNLSLTPCYFSPDEICDLCIKKGFRVGAISHTVVVKYEAMQAFSDQTGFFSVDLKWHADFYLWNAIAFRYGACYVPEGFGIFRCDANSYSGKPTSWTDRKQVYTAMLDILKKPELTDIASLFKRSGIFVEFSYSILVFLMLNPRYYEYLNKTYLRRAILYSLKAYKGNLGRKMPRLRSLYRLLKNSCKIKR